MLVILFALYTFLICGFIEMNIQQSFVQAISQTMTRYRIENDFLVCETNDFENFINEVAEFGYYFSVVKSTRLKGSIMFQCEKGFLPTHYFGSPFRKSLTRHYKCALPPIEVSRKRNERKLKKRIMNCSASLMMHKIIFYPDYTLLDELTHVSETMKRNVIRKLKNDMNSAIKIREYTKYYLRISLPFVHSHPAGPISQLEIQNSKIDERYNFDSGDICRICGERKSNMQVFQANPSLVQCITVANKLLPNSCKISEADGYSQNICDACTLKITKIAEFSQSCSAVQRGFRNIPEDEESEVVILCDVCGKNFKNKTLLRLHMRVHLDQHAKKKLQCNNCGKKFRNRAELCEHENIHKGITPYECAICKKCFYYRASLKQHVEIHRPEETKFKCDICSLVFSRRSNMIRHLRTHQKEDTYSCADCTEKCRNWKALLKHRKVSHNKPQAEEKALSSKTEVQIRS